MATLKSSENEGECCPKFDPAPWEDRMHYWDKKRFVVDTLPQFLHMPLPWKSEIYVAVDKEVEGVRNTTLSGNYFSKVFDGPYSSVPKSEA